VPNEHDLMEVAAFNLLHDVLNMGLLTGRHALLLRKARQRKRVSTAAGRQELWDDLIPRPRSQPGAWHQYELRHGGTVP
jgi:hypothetical protein